MTSQAISGKRRSAPTPARPRVEGPRLSPEVVRATAAFRASLRRFERNSDQVVLERGLTPRRYLLLLMIKGAPDGSERATVGELTDRLQLAQHTITELVGRAEEAGLIRRERSASDGRVSYLRLTVNGERRLARAFSDLDTERNALMAALDGAPTPEKLDGAATPKKLGAATPKKLDGAPTPKKRQA